MVIGRLSACLNYVFVLLAWIRVLGRIISWAHLSFKRLRLYCWSLYSNLCLRIVDMVDHLLRVLMIHVFNLTQGTFSLHGLLIPIWRLSLPDVSFLVYSFFDINNESSTFVNIWIRCLVSNQFRLELGWRLSIHQVFITLRLCFNYWLFHHSYSSCLF